MRIKDLRLGEFATIEKGRKIQFVGVSVDPYVAICSEIVGPYRFACVELPMDTKLVSW